MTVIEKMVEYQQHRGLSDYAIEKALGKSKGYWHTCKNPTAGIIQLFLERFPDISAEWLLRGEGSMLKGVPTPEHHVYDINYGNKVTGNGNITGNTGPVYAGEDCGLISSSINVTKLQDENAALTAENRDLRQKLEDANTRNAALTDKLLKLI